jgi:hypothetical protein
MHKYGESKTTRITVATVRHVTSSSGLRKFQAAWFLLQRGYKTLIPTTLYCISAQVKDINAYSIELH